MLGKQLTVLCIDAITVTIMTESILVRRAVYKSICLNILVAWGHNDFLNNVSITLINKTDGKNPKKREDYTRRTLTTFSPFGLNVEDSV